MHFNNELLFNKYAKQQFFSGAKVLEIGPQGSPSIYQNLAANTDLDWWSLDIVEGFAGKENPKFIYSKELYNYPVQDNSFDIVFSGGVMCNVGEVWTWMAELKRIVKPGGLIITITPVSWPYANAPIDCWRIYPDGMKAVNNFLSLHTIHCSVEGLELEHFGYDKKLVDSHNIKIPYVSVAGYDNSRKMSAINKQKMAVNKVLNRFPFIRRYLNPVHHAIDTICIAKKVN